MTSGVDDQPAFENPFESAVSAEQRVYRTLVQTRTPTTVRGIADGADCDPKTARKYVEWFTTLGIATKHDGETPTYERNDRYFEWRRINELAATHTAPELHSAVESLTSRISSYKDRYNADHPGAVDALSPPAGISTETAFADLTDWQTARSELRHHEQARRLKTGDAGYPVRQP